MNSKLIQATDVRTAAGRISGSITNTPFLLSHTLSELAGAEVWLKFENLQFTASFKERGALNKLLTLDADCRQRGVVAVSAGNHAQGVALHARRLGIPATIVMPQTTPRIKVARTQALGARVVLAGDSFAAASLEVPRYVGEGLTFIHPFDDDLVIAGQGTVGLEMLAAQPDLDAIVVAVGGGGLISGIAAVASEEAPATEIVGVQSERFPSMALALGQFHGSIPGGTSVAEGIAVAEAGARTREHVHALVKDIIVVSEAAIEDGVAHLLQIEKTLTEGAGAAGLAAVLAEPDRFRGRKVGLILCGGNIDTRVLIAMLQRHLARAGQLVRLSFGVLDHAGPLGRIASIIAGRGGNILDVQHDRVFSGASARAATLTIDVEVSDGAEIPPLLAEIEAAGYPASVAPLVQSMP